MKSKRDLACYLSDRLLGLELLDGGNFGSYQEQFEAVEKEVLSVLEDYHIILGKLLP